MAQWNQCFYCGKHLVRKKITFDHVVPESYGGDQLVTACHPCNCLKGDYSVEEFRILLNVDKFYGELRGWKPW